MSVNSLGNSKSVVGLFIAHELAGTPFRNRTRSRGSPSGGLEFSEIPPVQEHRWRVIGKFRSRVARLVRSSGKMEVGLGCRIRARKFDGFDHRRSPWPEMIPCYFDTGLVLKLVVKEPLSELVLDFVSSRKLVVPYTGFVELECANAIAAKVYRGEFDPGQSSAAQGLIGDFLRQGLFARIPLDMSAVVRDTVELVARSTSSTGCRTLDLLHIASALALGAEVFATGDSRQAKAARVCGLEVVEIRL